MEAPRIGLSLEDLNAAIKAHNEQMYEDTNEGLRCKACGSGVKSVPCAVSIHRTAPGGRCEGFGEDVEHFPLPYCPQCEGEPASRSTCVHIGAERITTSFGGLSEDTGQLELL